MKPALTHLNRSLQTWTVGFEDSLSVHAL